MYGKHFASMYSGSMVGKGAMVFAVWGYVIANMKPDREYGMVVEFNPTVLATILGEGVKEVREAVETLKAEDPESRSKEEGGKRLVQLGEYSYRVVNGVYYRAIQDEEERRAKDAERKRRERERVKGEVNLRAARKAGAHGDGGQKGREMG